MDFGMLPPEVNSARMYAGAGAGPLLTAATAWDGLAAELRSAAASYSSVISGLAGNSWSGAASVSMAAAAAPYVAWMHTTAAQAEQSADQARAAAGAYETAFAMTVAPPVIAANRSLVTALVATNFLGQNAPAIAATEAHYAEMWVQDAAAMYGYAGSSAAASTLSPFTSPPHTTNSGGSAAQGTAAAQAAGTSAGNAQAALSQLMAATPQTLQGLASPLPSAAATSSAAELTGAAAAAGSASGGSSTALSLSELLYPLIFGSMMPMRAMSMVNMARSLATGVTAAKAVAPAVGTALMSGVGAGSGALGSAGLGGAAVSAGLGRATSIGALSVPQMWSAAGPAPVSLMSGLPSAAAPTATLASVSGYQPGGSAAIPPMTPITNLAAQNTANAAPRYGFRLAVMARPPAAG